MEYFLIFHLPRTLGAYPLYRKIEKRNGIRRNIVVVDARPQEFPRTRAHCLQLERTRARPQRQRRRARAIDHADDEGFAPAVVEKLFDRIAQQTRLPQTAEYVLEFAETLDENRAVHRSAQRAADEGGARRGEARDGSVKAAFFVDLYAWAARRHQIFFAGSMRPNCNTTA